jgi:NMD protein affecting ribosome stability and mRNA decay
MIIPFYTPCVECGSTDIQNLLENTGISPEKVLVAKCVNCGNWRYKDQWNALNPIEEEPGLTKEELLIKISNVVPQVVTFIKEVAKNTHTASRYITKDVIIKFEQELHRAINKGE